MKNSGPEITSNDIELLEKKYSIKIPSELVAFLLKYNGGAPSPRDINIPSLRGSPTDVQVFFGINRSILSSNIDWNVELLKSVVSDYQSDIPIACDSGGGIYAISPTRNNPTEVIYIDTTSVPVLTHLASNSFDEFLLRVTSNL